MKMSSVSLGTLKVTLTALVLIAGGAASAFGGSKNSAPAPKPAPSHASAPAPKPSGSVSRPGPVGASHVSGPSVSHANGPSANHPAGPSANHPAGPSANHIGGPGANHIGGPGANHSGGPSNGFRAAGGHPMPNGVHDRALAGGGNIRTRSNGRISDVHDARRGMDVHHGLNGNRRISVERADHSRIVGMRGWPGFVQHPYAFHGHDFARRTYFYHGRMYSHFYRGYPYHGMYLHVYAPGFYFRPAFYGWAYNPWAAPITFAWGWGAAPWYGYYGAYFTPFATYPSAPYWLTDYMISNDLQEAYNAQQEAGEANGAPVAAGGAPTLTPEIKQEIASEVQAQLALENAEAQQNAQGQEADPGSSGIARMTSDGKPHTLLVSSALDVTDASGNECSLSDGDVLQLATLPASDASEANLIVLASKGGNECQAHDTVAIGLDDLQEMQNQMRATIDQGLQELQSKQGTGGIPKLPPSAQGQPADAQYAAAAPPPDANAGAEIQQQMQEADQAEKEDTGAAAPAVPAAIAAPPAAVSLGQTTDQVQSALGAPTRVANLGPKVIYYYNGMKVTFKDGKVSDVQ